MDWNHPPQRVHPPRRHASFTSIAPTSLPSFYSNPVSYHPLSEVSFLTLVLQRAACFLIHQGGSSRQDSYCDSQWHGRQEWNHMSQEVVKRWNSCLILHSSRSLASTILCLAVWSIKIIYCFDLQIRQPSTSLGDKNRDTFPWINIVNRWITPNLWAFSLVKASKKMTSEMQNANPTFSWLVKMCFQVHLM